MEFVKSYNYSKSVILNLFKAIIVKV